MIHTGGCLCARVRYQIQGQPGSLVYCHCLQCRKAQGAGFVANVPVAREHFKITAGIEWISTFCSSADKTRYFCSNCGAALYSYLREAANVRIRAGSLDPGAKIIPVAHIFTAAKASWITITDDLPQYVAREPRQP
jgi:hypothetical protein